MKRILLTLVGVALVSACGEAADPTTPAAVDDYGWGTIPSGDIQTAGAVIAHFNGPSANVTSGAITNGSFETGDYTGWTLWEGPNNVPTFGTWGIATNGQTIAGGAGVFDYFNGILVYQNSPGLPHTYTATDGNYVALQLQNGSQSHRMYQDVILPGAKSQLTWDMEFHNWDGSFAPAQRLSVNVRDPNTDAVLGTLFGTAAGDPISIPMTHFEADLSAWSGQTVRLSVDMVVNNFFFDAAFDNFIVDILDPVTKDDCKNGGWEQYGFKNQGQCVRFVETGKDSR